jgi:hypothetical protein
MDVRRPLLTLFAVLCGCAVDRGPLKLPDPIPLIAPEAGKAVVYLLRVPHEPFEVVIQLNGARTAALPKETFTAIALVPGRHELLAVHPNPAVPSAPAVITVTADERRFLYTSAPTRGQISTTFVPIGVGVIPMFIPGQVNVGARRWVEASELDAQGLFSILKPIGAEANAP